jgi:protoporphyrinogen oxidase
VSEKKKTLSIAIIGAGASGLSLAEYLLREKNLDIKCDLYERQSNTGGLAANSESFQGIERFYHHIFKSDKEIRALAKKLRIQIKWKSLKTSNFYLDNGLIPVDTIYGVMQNLGVKSGIHLMYGVSLIKLRIAKEKSELGIAEQALRLFGEKATNEIWIPLLSQKFGEKWHEISIKWLFSRIRDRSFKLGVIENGFGSLWEELEKQLGLDVRFEKLLANLEGIYRSDEGYYLKFASDKNQLSRAYDYVIDTSGSFFVKDSLKNEYQSAICVIVELNRKVETNFYWLNLLPLEMFFTVVINHTKILSLFKTQDVSYLYLARYIDRTNAELFDTALGREKLKEIAEKELRQVFEFENVADFSVVASEVNIARNAQPLFTLENIQLIPKKHIMTENLFSINLWNTFPHDRGQNYAIAEAQRLGKLLLTSISSSRP